jgi:hypothetical protein
VGYYSSLSGVLERVREERIKTLGKHTVGELYELLQVQTGELKDIAARLKGRVNPGNDWADSDQVKQALGRLDSLITGVSLACLESDLLGPRSVAVGQSCDWILVPEDLENIGDLVEALEGAKRLHERLKAAEDQQIDPSNDLILCAYSWSIGHQIEILESYLSNVRG